MSLEDRRASEYRPLLPSHTSHFKNDNDEASHEHFGFHKHARYHVKRFLTSKAGHYSVLGVVALDVTTIFADLLLQMMICEGHVGRKPGNEAQEVLGILSLVFSTLFMVELVASVWAFGWS